MNRSKISGSRFAALLVVVVLFAGGCATAPSTRTAERALPPPRIDESRPTHVSVESPITHPWIWSDEVAESFYSWISKGFRAGGYTGGLVYVQPGVAAPAASQQLALRIVRWRVARDGSVEAVMTATFNSGSSGDRDMGLISGQSMSYFMSPNRLGLERGFDESAQDAARQLLSRFAR